MNTTWAHTGGTPSVLGQNVTDTEMVELVGYPSYQLTYQVVTGLVTALVMISSIISMWIIHQSPLLPANRYFLYSLSISDLLQSVVTLPLSITTAISDDWDFLPPYFQLLQISLSVHLWLTSVYSLAFINIDHYVAVTEPVHYLTQLGPRKSSCWVIFIWILGLTYSLPLFLIGPMRAVTCSPKIMYCTLNYEQIAAYSVTATVILVPPPVLIFIVTGCRCLCPKADDEDKASQERLSMFKANTAAGIVTLILWTLGLTGQFLADLHTVYRLATFWVGLSAPVWRVVSYGAIASSTIQYVYSEPYQAGIVL